MKPQILTAQHSPTERRNSARVLLLIAALAIGAITLTSGCRITEEDVHLWGRKSMGPTKLVAVLQHDKYPRNLRVESALTLTTMPPRGGRAVGMLGTDDYPGLFQALSEMTAGERAPIVDELAPHLIEGMGQAPSADQPDPSFKYKDAAYGMLTHTEGSLVSNATTTEALNQALVGWANTDFEARMDNTSQVFGMEQVLRYLKTEGVRPLPSRITPESHKLAELTRLIDELGDEKTKVEASQQLVKVAEYVDSDAWVKQKSPSVQAANKASGIEATEKQFAQQLAAYQEEEQRRVFAAMKNVGQKPAVNYLIAYAQNTKHAPKARAAALAALEGHLSRNDSTQAKAILDLLSNDDTPDIMRDLAANRVGEFAREEVAARLFELFKNPNWRVRATAAQLLLKTSSKTNIDEFMKELGRVRSMALSEPLAYGPLLKEVDQAQPAELSSQYSKPTYPVGVRLTALGYYFSEGDKDDQAQLSPYLSDRTKVPSCPKDDQQCSWTCNLVEEGKAVARKVSTVGEFIRFCILPPLLSRAPEESEETEENKPKNAEAPAPVKK
ncbi:MAG: HEAT repeat domain-containing protein [Polyangiaceae bacterium]|nr:HEAT repeat domain-containing protein [Polyangiaceae bacterium]